MQYREYILITNPKIVCSYCARCKLQPNKVRVSYVHAYHFFTGSEIDSGLSAGALAGVVVGTVVICFLFLTTVTATALLYWERRRVSTCS